LKSRERQQACWRSLSCTIRGGDEPLILRATNEEEAMKSVSRLFAACIVAALAALTGFAVPAHAEGSPVATEQTKEVEALVTKAAALIDKDGKAAFADLRKANSDWFHGTTYLFVYDLKSNVLLNPAFPTREGTNTTGQKDAKGKLFHHEFIQVAETKGSGWVDYMFPKPGQTEPSRKWAFVKKVTVDGVPGLVASGFYPD
jgi:cytochrome c